MADDEKPQQGDEDKRPSKPPRKSVVADIVESGIFSHKRDGEKDGDEPKVRISHPSDRAARRSVAPDSREQQRERAKFLAEKYEKIIAARQSVDVSAAHVSSDAAASAAAADKGKSRKTWAPSKVFKTKTSATPSSSVFQKAASRSRVCGLSDLDAGTQQPQPPEQRTTLSPFSRKRTEGGTFTAPPAGCPGCRPSRCVLRRGVKQKIFPGRLILTISSTLVMIVLFTWQLHQNLVTFNGRCIAHVDYSDRVNNLPFYSPLGYVACERSLNTTAESRFLSGKEAGDEGYPTNFVHSGNQAASDAPSDGPNYRLAAFLGAVSANKIRIYGESFRLWMSIFLHGGYWHIGFNLLVNVQLLYVIEPDWGFLKTLVAYVFCGYSANLVHASMSPCYESVGASGALFALSGAILPYCIEHWDQLVSPCLLALGSLLLLMFELIFPKKETSAQAHMGGYVFGLCFGFATIKAVTLFDRGALYQRFMMKVFSRWLSDSTKHKYAGKIYKSTQSEEMARIQYEHKAKANAGRFKFLKRTFGVYPYGPYRMRLRDILTRFVFLAVLIAMFAYFYMATYVESVYSRLSAGTSPFFCSACHCGYLKSEGITEIQKKQIAHLAGKFYCFQSVQTRDAYCV